MAIATLMCEVHLHLASLYFYMKTCNMLSSLKQWQKHTCYNSLR